MKRTINIIDHYVVRPATPVRPLRCKTGFACKTILALCLLSFVLCPLHAQSDSALNRTIMVERDFQPVIQAAGKVSTKPSVVTKTIEPTPVEYSTYTAEVAPAPTISSMLSQPTRFEAGKEYDGYIRGGLGHPQTLFDFGYHKDDGKNSILDVYAHHKAEWGLAALSKTKVGLDFKHPFSTCDLYFGVNGGNIYYHKYGHFYDYSQEHGLWAKNSDAYPEPHEIGKPDKTALWTTEAFLGVKANAKQDFQYQFQTGYMLFSKPGAVTEHQVRTHASFDWHRDMHHVGAVIYVQNNFLQLGTIGDVIPDSLYDKSRHNFRIEPYYAYEGKRMRIHVGVNLNLNIGRGHHHLTNNEKLSFAPSPHINFEAQVAKQWLTVYADVTGYQGVGSLQSYMEENRYSLIHAGIIHPCGAYIPVDAEFGFHIRPYRDLLIELHGGYAYMMDEDYWIATADTITPLAALGIRRPLGDFIHHHTDYQRGKIGGQIHYHYRDIINIHFYGDAYFWKGDTTVYDRAKWEMGLRVDGRIDKHWSLYSENKFVGSRKALATDGEHTLAPIVDLNLGVQYEMMVGQGKGKSEKVKVKSNGEQVLRPEPQPNLALFFQLDNWLHRKNEYLYGYRSQGIGFLMGATFRF